MRKQVIVMDCAAPMRKDSVVVEATCTKQDSEKASEKAIKNSDVLRLLVLVHDYYYYCLFIRVPDPDKMAKSSTHLLLGIRDPAPPPDLMNLEPADRHLLGFLSAPPQQRQQSEKQQMA